MQSPSFTEVARGGVGDETRGTSDGRSERARERMSHRMAGLGMRVSPSDLIVAVNSTAC